MKLFLPLFAICFAVGVVGGTALGPAPVPTLLVAGGAWVVAALSRRRAVPCTLLLFCGALAAGAALAALRLHRPAAACRGTLRTGDIVRLVAVVEDEPVVTTEAQHQLLRATAVADVAGERAACGMVELHRPVEARPLWVGERVVVRGRLRAAVGARNPGTPSARLRYLSDGVGAVVWADDTAVAVIGARSPSWTEGLRERIRAAMARCIRDGDARAVVAALVIGEEQRIDPALRQDYARAGLSHLLAVSGLNLSLVAFASLLALRWLVVRVPGVGERVDPGQIAAPIAAVVAIFYTLLAGAAPSAVRSCIMACACYVGLVWSRPPDVARPLAAAALALLVWDPLDLFRPSFQLSFAAVIGIALVARRVAERRISREEEEEGGWLRRCGRWAWSLLLATFAATLLTAPIVAHHFHQISVAGLVTNLVAVPLSSFVLMPLALVGATLGAVHPQLAQPVLWLAGHVAGALNLLCRATSGCPGAALSFSLGWIGALGLGALGVAALTRGGARRAALVCGLLPLAVAGVEAGVRHVMSPTLDAVFLDVGQGDSTLVRFPAGGAMLVDGGGALPIGVPRPSGGRYDPGASRVVPFLQAAGVRRLEVVVASHPHPDHVGGLAAVLSAFSVGELWVCWHDEPEPPLTALLEVARRRGVKVTWPHVLRRADGAVVEPLWPVGEAGHCADPGEPANDNSVVLRVAYGDAALLLAGDIEEETERRLAAREPERLRATVLKVPHHGSATSSSIALLRAVAPRLAVISCGVQNSFGFPAPSVLARYREHAIEVVRVDQLGALGVQLDRRGALRWEALAAGVIP